MNYLIVIKRLHAESVNFRFKAHDRLFHLFSGLVNRRMMLLEGFFRKLSVMV